MAEANAAGSSWNRGRGCFLDIWYVSFSVVSTWRQHFSCQIVTVMRFVWSRNKHVPNVTVVPGTQHRRKNMAKLHFSWGKGCKPVGSFAVDLCQNRSPFTFSPKSMTTVNLLFLNFVSFFMLEPPHACWKPLLACAIGTKSHMKLRSSFSLTSTLTSEGVFPPSSITCAYFAEDVPQLCRRI